MNKLTALFLLTALACAPLIDSPTAAAKCTKSTKAAQTGVYRITFTKSGGFAATNQKYQLDSNKLEKPAQSTLADLITKSGVLRIKSEMKTTPGAADMFFYEFKVEHKGQPHRAAFDDGTIPQSYRDLAAFVTSNGVKQ